MNIFLHEFKMNRRSVIIWSLSIFAIILFFMSILSSVAIDVGKMNELLANYPPELLTAFGLDGLDLSTVLGYFGFTFLFCQICVSIQAANYGVSLISIEERDLTADFLLAKPVSRRKILTAKLLAALTSLGITNAVVWIASFSAISLFGDGRAYDTKTLLLLLFTITFLQLFFLSVGLLVSLLMKKVKSVTPISMGLVFGLYVLNAFGGDLDDNKFAFITPFSHFEANAIIQNGAYDMPLVLISVVVIIASAAVSYFMYQKRDIHSV